MDEVTAALVHQRAIQVTVVTRTKVCEEAIHSAQVLLVAAGMNNYVNTSVYISENEVELSLGTYA